MTELKKIGNWNAIIDFDENEKKYTFMSSEKGGAIISHQNKQVAEIRWMNAMRLTEFVRKTFFYKRMYDLRNLN